MRTYSTSLRIEEIEIKTTQGYEFLLWEIFLNDPPNTQHLSRYNEIVPHISLVTM